MRGLCGLRRSFRIDHELDDAGVVAQVDEDEPAVVATTGDPPSDRDPVADLLGANVAGIEVTPGVHRPWHGR